MEDRRIKKTKQAIQLAFAKLLSEKSMDHITVKSLCETADINKSTFYLHYQDIYDCADCIRDTIVDEFCEVIAPYRFEEMIVNFEVILDDIIRMFDRNKHIYVPFLKSPSLASSSCKLKQLIIERVLAKAGVEDQKDKIFRCTVSFIMSGIMSLLEQHEFTEIDHQTVSALAYKVKNGFTAL